MTNRADRYPIADGDPGDLPPDENLLTALEIDETQGERHLHSGADKRYLIMPRDADEPFSVYAVADPHGKSETIDGIDRFLATELFINWPGVVYDLPVGGVLALIDEPGVGRLSLKVSLSRVTIHEIAVNDLPSLDNGVM